MVPLYSRLFFAMFVCVSVRLASAQEDGPSVLSSAPQAGGTAGPTLQQTVDFINTKTGKQVGKGLFVEKAQLQGCTLMWHTERSESAHGAVARLASLHLDESDPFSVAVTGDDAKGYSVQIDRAKAMFFTEIYLPWSQPTNYKYSDSMGFQYVAAHTPEGLLVVDGSGVPRLLDFNNGEDGRRIQRFKRLENNRSSKLKVEQLVPGDKIMINEEKDFGSGGPLELIWVGHEAVPKERTAAEFEAAIKKDEQMLAAPSASPALKPFGLANLGSGNKDGAERVAKALIHAIVQCQQSKPASLF